MTKTVKPKYADTVSHSCQLLTNLSGGVSNRNMFIMSDRTQSLTSNRL
ncbi:hypothetical protein [Calothrix sp. NIES-2098]